MLVDFNEKITGVRKGGFKFVKYVPMSYKMTAKELRAKSTTALAKAPNSRLEMKEKNDQKSLDEIAAELKIKKKERNEREAVR